MFVLYTNSTLYKWKVVNADKCEFCNETQTLKHLFWDCEYAKTMYNHIQDICNCHTMWTFREIFTCKTDSSKLVNQLILHAKMYIYTCKCSNEKPEVGVFHSKILYLHKIERNIAILENKKSLHVDKWQEVKI